MTVKLHLEFLRQKGGCTGSSESTHVKMPHCWKLHVTAHFYNTIFRESVIGQQQEQLNMYELEMRQMKEQVL